MASKLCDANLVLCFAGTGYIMGVDNFSNVCSPLKNCTEMSPRWNSVVCLHSVSGPTAVIVGCTVCAVFANDSKETLRGTVDHLHSALIVGSMYYVRSGDCMHGAVTSNPRWASERPVADGQLIYSNPHLPSNCLVIETRRNRFESALSKSLSRLKLKRHIGLLSTDYCIDQSCQGLTSEL